MTHQERNLLRALCNENYLQDETLRDGVVELLDYCEDLENRLAEQRQEAHAKRQEQFKEELLRLRGRKNT